VALLEQNYDFARIKPSRIQISLHFERRRILNMAITATLSAYLKSKSKNFNVFKVKPGVKI